MTCGEQWCGTCGDKLIHLTNRGEHESSSAFGQFIHDQGEALRGDWAQMYWTDIDGAIYKKSTEILRVIEHKPHLGTPSAGQREVLPLLAKGIQLLVGAGQVHPQSGVFIVNSDPPYKTLAVTQQSGWRDHRPKVWGPAKLERLRDVFLQGKEVDPLDEET